MNKPINRVKQIIDYYRLNPSSFEKEIGVSNNSINVALKRESNLKDETLNSILNKFEEISAEWLLMGKGEMIKNNVSDKIITSDLNGVPYYEDIEATATISSSFSDFKETPTFYIDYEHFNDCTAYVQVVGDSMYPSFCSGEIIAIKKIFNLDVLWWGEAYFVVTNQNANDLKAVKLLFQNEDDSKLTLRSSNPNFKGDTLIDKKDILHLYLVKGKIHRKHL